ncbi:MAG: Rho termination factor N-terminal domain-containing protein [Nitrospinota bacterium]|nr:Rho termination factor N-terminal domain-containing protein [Nitrospinota bacterium]
MKMEEIREFAKTLGIQSVSKFTKKDDLIRTIQLAEGNEDCFRRDVGYNCQRTNCLWYVDCVKA